MTEHRYVAGFLFSADRQKVVLIQKKRPQWQAGRLNGVGGKVEEGESWEEAMAREFREEAGLSYPPEAWKHVVTLKGADFECRFFQLTDEEGRIFEAAPQTDEAIFICSVDTLHQENILPNLRWLIPIALDEDIQKPIWVFDRFPNGK